MQDNPMMMYPTTWQRSNIAGPGRLAPTQAPNPRLTTASAMGYGQAEHLADARAGNPRLTTANEMDYVQAVRATMARNPSLGYMEAHNYVMGAYPKLRKQGVDYLEAVKLAQRQGNPVPPKRAVVRRKMAQLAPQGPTPQSAGPKQVTQAPVGVGVYVTYQGDQAYLNVRIFANQAYPTIAPANVERLPGNKARIMGSPGPSTNFVDNYKGKVVPIKLPTRANPPARPGRARRHRWTGPDAAGVCFDAHAGVLWAANASGPNPAHPLYGIGVQLVSYTTAPAGAKYPAGVKPTNQWAYVRHGVWGTLRVPVCRQSGAGAPIGRGRGAPAQPTAAPGPGGLPGGSGKPAPTQMQGYISEGQPWPIQPGTPAPYGQCPPGCEVVHLSKTDQAHQCGDESFMAAHDLFNCYVCARPTPLDWHNWAQYEVCWDHMKPGSWKPGAGAAKRPAFRSPLAPTPAKNDAPTLLESCPPNYYYAYGWGCLPIPKDGNPGDPMWDHAGGFADRRAPARRGANPTPGARAIQKRMRRRLAQNRQQNPGCSACATKVPGGVQRG